MADAKQKALNFRTDLFLAIGQKNWETASKLLSILYDRTRNKSMRRILINDDTFLNQLILAHNASNGITRSVLGSFLSQDLVL